MFIVFITPRFDFGDTKRGGLVSYKINPLHQIYKRKERIAVLRLLAGFYSANLLRLSQ